MTLRRFALGTALALLGATSAHAEVFGLLNGRSANPGTLPDLSVEGGFITGNDYRNIGARVNYRLTPELVVFGDFGLIDVDPFDGNAYGVGAYYYLANQRLISTADVAVKASYHISPLSGSASGLAGTSVDADVDFNAIAIEAIVSGREPIAQNGLMWYANLGADILNRSGDAGDKNSSEFLIGGGVYLPVGPGEAYAGADYIDDLQFGVGYRYFIK